jgi:hypothetical protein
MDWTGLKSESAAGFLVLENRAILEAFTGEGFLLLWQKEVSPSSLQIVQSTLKNIKFHPREE